MLIPRFTIRTMLAMLTAGAVVFLIAGMAVRGRMWAWGVTVGIGSLALVALVHAFWFGIVWLFAQLPKSRRSAEDATRQIVVLLSATLAPLLGDPPAACGQFGPANMGNFANGWTAELPVAPPLSQQPFPGSRQNGLRIEIDARWATGYGYRPVKVTVRSTAPVAADRTIRVRLYVSGTYLPLASNFVVQQDVEMPRGSGSVTAHIAFPQFSASHWSGGGTYWWDVFVDGERDAELSVKREASPFVQNNSTMRVWTMLEVSQIATPRLSGPGSRPEFEVLTLPAAELPTRWIDYTCLDVVALTAADLRRVAATNENALTAILRWTRAGGNLWISDLGDDLQRLAEVEGQLGLSGRPRDASEAAPAAVTDEEAAERGWEPQRPRPITLDGQPVTFFERRTGRELIESDPQIINQLRADPDYSIASDDEKLLLALDQLLRRGDERTTIDSHRWFLDQQLGFGTVRAIRGRDALAAWGQWSDASAAASARAGVADQSAAAAGAYSPRHPALPAQDTQFPNWTVRHGFSPDAPNREFLDWLVPGVGLAPVGMFRVLITLFVLLIGPVLYWLLKRFHRLHLLVIAVPLAAAALTIGIFSYALFSDGLGTKVRIRSVTMLDQAQGEVASWSRLSYYAGLAPGRGLSMPNDVAIYPLFSGSEFRRNGDLGAARELEWDENRALFTRGWLRSRTPTQYLAVRAGTSSQRIVLRAENGRMQGGNSLGTAIRYVVVADSAGKLFAGENVPQGATAELEPVEPAVAEERWRTLVRENRPQPPLEATDAYALSQLSFDRRSRNNQYYFPATRLSNNLMEKTLADWTGMDGQPTNWGRRTYLALAETSPEIALGVPNASEEASFHVVIGKW